MAEYGDPRLPERFWVKILRSEGGCWVWRAGLDPEGYPRFWVGTTRAAHRVAFEVLVGPIPDGLELDHLCRNPSCVNPDHLEPVTGDENWRRSSAQTVLHAAKTHCDHGHEFTPENTYRYRRPSSQRWRRICRACNAAAQRRRKARLAKKVAS